jgi:hypothetical protein
VRRWALRLVLKDDSSVVVDACYLREGEEFQQGLVIQFPCFTAIMGRALDQLRPTRIGNSRVMGAN